MWTLTSALAWDCGRDTRHGSAPNDLAAKYTGPMCCQIIQLQIP